MAKPIVFIPSPVCIAKMDAIDLLHPAEISHPKPQQTAEDVSEGLTSAEESCDFSCCSEPDNDTDIPSEKAEASFPQSVDLDLNNSNSKKEQQESQEETSHVFHQGIQPNRSILKHKSLEGSCQHVLEKRGSWKQLPKLSQEFHRALQSRSEEWSVADHHEHETEKSNPNNNKKVSFVSVQIRLYQQCLGDNPAVSYGPPISLDWEYQECGSMDIDLFEAQHHHHQRQKIPLRLLTLNYYQRMILLQNKLGVSLHDIQSADSQVRRIKRQRAMTHALLPARKLEEIIQSAARKSKRLCGHSQ